MVVNQVGRSPSSGLPQVDNALSSQSHHTTNKMGKREATCTSTPDTPTPTGSRGPQLLRISPKASQGCQFSKRAGEVVVRNTQPPATDQDVQYNIQVRRLRKGIPQHNNLGAHHRCKSHHRLVRALRGLNSDSGMVTLLLLISRALTAGRTHTTRWQIHGPPCTRGAPLLHQVEAPN
jgi:hypothetical protein